MNKTTHDTDDAEKEEADRVAANITKLLNEKSFSLTSLEFLNIHRHLFEGVFKHAGEIRPYDISKKEWVLQGDTVVYGRAADIHEALKHVVDFVTLLWGTIRSMKETREQRLFSLSNISALVVSM